MQRVPVLADPLFQKRILNRSQTPGVLGLELPEDLAERLFERFKAVGAEGYCFSSAYHHPHISGEQAMDIAVPVIEKRRQKIVPTDTLGPLFLFGEEPLYWTVGAASEQLMNEGILPGALFASVDKLDGHVWEWEEIRRFQKKYE